MYSFAPIDPAPYWGLLAVMLIIVSVFTIVWAAIEDILPSDALITWGAGCAATIAVFFWVVEAPKPPLNTPVTATLLESDYVLTEKSGKHSTSDNRYLMYMTPDGPVSFRRYDGKVYPKQAILYKN